MSIDNLAPGVTLYRPMATVHAHVMSRLKQHSHNLKLWRSGYLAPTEPDPEDRMVVMRELVAAMTELVGVSISIGCGCEMKAPTYPICRNTQHHPDCDYWPYEVQVKRFHDRKFGPYP